MTRTVYLSLLAVALGAAASPLSTSPHAVPHGRSPLAVAPLLVDAFLRAVVATRPADARVLVCSDHGNVEDLSTRSHTLHPVPVLYFGPPAPELEALGTVADVGRAILGWWGQT